MKSLFYIELERSIKETYSYKINIILANISLIIMFTGLLAFSNSPLTASTQISMMLAWYVCIHGIANPTYIVEEEVMDGTLINILASNKSLFTIILIRGLVQYIVDIFKVSIMLILIVLVTNISFTAMELLSLFLLISLIAVISYFIGILLSSFTLVYNKTSNLIGVFYYFILFFSGGFFIIENVFVVGINMLFPFYVFNSITDQLFIEHTINYKLVVVLLVQLVFYFTLSYYVFNKKVERKLHVGDYDYV